jgi:hypothetical protein
VHDGRKKSLMVKLQSCRTTRLMNSRKASSDKLQMAISETLHTAVACKSNTVHLAVCRPTGMHHASVLTSHSCYCQAMSRKNKDGTDIASMHYSINCLVAAKFGRLAVCAMHQRAKHGIA